MHAKKPWVAFVLSFLLPGSGLVYLGRVKAGVLNFVLVHLFLVGLLSLQEPTVLEHIHYVFLALAAASAGYAHAVAAPHDSFTPHTAG